VLSNCVNSGIRRISIMTQYKAHSLVQHIQRGWGYLRGEFDEFVEVIPAQQQMGNSGIAARPIRSTRTCRSSACTIRVTCWCWPATTSTRWTTARCSPRTSRSAPTSPSASSRCRASRRPPFGVMSVDPTTASPSSRRSRRSPRASRAASSSRSARWASTCSRRTCCTACWRKTPSARHESRFRPQHHSATRSAR
jgi:hypothetical protein